MARRRLLPPSNPYAAGLAMLARRELSAAQVTERLRRRGFAPAEVEAAVRRLRRECALDDHRAATVHARHAARIAHRGPLRVEREIIALGIAPATARAVVAEVYAEEHTETVIGRALARRLPAGAAVEDRAHFARLHRRLVRQGFDPQMAAETLDARAGASTPADDEPSS